MHTPKKFSFKVTNCPIYSENCLPIITTSAQKLQQDWDYLVHICNTIHKQTGASYGKILRRLLKNGQAAGEYTEDDIANVALLLSPGSLQTVHFSSSQNTFIKAYNDVESCMQYEGVKVHDTFSPYGIFIAGIKHHGTPDIYIARALVTDKGTYYTEYGTAHYSLKSVLKILGLSKTNYWLKGVADSDNEIRKRFKDLKKKQYGTREEKIWETEIRIKNPDNAVFVAFKAPSLQEEKELQKLIYKNYRLPVYVPSEIHQNRLHVIKITVEGKELQYYMRPEDLEEVYTSKIIQVPLNDQDPAYID